MYLQLPFGHTVGNVFHNNAGFGWYVNTAFPMNLIELGGVETASDGAQMKGTVTDWSKCMPFSEHGEDHSFNVVVQDHTEYFNDFSAGVYSVGDITLKNYTNYGSNKRLYWKTYRRGAESGPICENCRFIRTSIEGPGGSGLVEFQTPNSTVLTKPIRSTITAPLMVALAAYVPHTTISRSSQFFQWIGGEDLYTEGNAFFYSGVDPHSTLIFTPDEKVLLHVTDNVAFDIDNDPRCQDSTAYAGDGWYECDNSQVDTNGDKIELRLVRIYSPNRGDLTITNHSEGDLQHVIPWTEYGPQGGGATAYGVLPRSGG